jgi:hypothetical protein
MKRAVEPYLSMKVLVTVVPEQAVPRIPLLLGLLVVGVGGMAISRAVRRAQAVYRTRRALRSAGGGGDERWPEAWWNVIEKPEEGHKRRRRALR